MSDEELERKIAVHIDDRGNTNYIAIMQLIKSRDQQIALAERRRFRELWDSLGMQFGASAGNATGVIVKNVFGEEFDFQLDRDAINNIHKYLNDKSPAAINSKQEKEL